ncbi:MAG: glycine--tRNA ligase subunit beta [Pseudomonadota bacterium]
METLLLEIGTEEIPAGYIEPALNAMSATLLKKMVGARIAHGRVKIYATPRRLAVEVEKVANKQTPLTSEVFGPPEKVGFDDKGQPTVAAKKFAEKIGVPVNALKVMDTDKGRYLCAKITERGLPTRALLKDILPQVILATPFPKSMKWAELDIEFARPIHSIMALLGDKVIPFTLGDTRSGRYTSGHYFMNPGKIKISHPADYVDILRSANVLVDLAERRKRVVQEVEKAAKKAGGAVLPDDELVDIVKNLVEYPLATVGKFDPAFLEVPREVLITAMREHQKYFAVIDKKGKLMPCFIAVNNTRTKDMNLVATGHEWVLRARLSDAQFFYRSDLAETFEKRVENLKGVLFQAKLGSMHEKIKRVQAIAGFLADSADKGSNLKKHAIRAAWLCKADLVSHVVGEFPKLQGVMGRVYATVDKEPEAVAAAIEEHYRPVYSGGALPETDAGAVLGIADKIDNICGFFSVGLVPTGASDPYALRRQGIGIIQIMLGKGFSFSLKGMIEKSLKLFGIKKAKNIRQIADDVHAFLNNRMAYQLAEEGFSKDVVAAVSSVSVDNVPDVWNRAGALQKLKAAPDFEPLAGAVKRVVNIMKKAGPRVGKAVDEGLLQEKSEIALYTAYEKANKKVSESLKKGNFDKALLDIASLRDPVDAFFEGVMVMAKDKKVRNNRLALLGQISNLFEQIADFSKITT